MAKPRTFVIPDLTDEEHKRIKLAAVESGWSLGALLRRLLELWMAGKVKVGQPPKRGEKAP